MSITRRHLLGGAAFLPLASLAQTPPAGFPSKPIRVFVGFAPGGGTDTAARVLAPSLTHVLGQPLVIENRAGAGGNIATEAAAKAPPDGYTLLMITTGQMITNPLGMKMSFSPEREIVPLGRITASPMVLVVPAESPFKSAKEFIAQAKAKKGEINYGSAGIGTVQHLGMEQFKFAAGFNATHIAYKGSGPAVMDLISGKIDVIMESSTAATPQIKAGTLRALAVTSDQPVAELPGIPVLSSIVPGLVVMSWTGLAGPAGMPPELVTFLSDAIKRAMADGSVAAKLREQGAHASWLSAADFAKAIGAERETTAELMKRANIKLDS